MDAGADAEGFDDLFNPGLFRTGLAAGTRARPRAWPRSVSEMRGHVSFAGQGLGPDATDHAFSQYAGARPYERRAQAAPARSHFAGRDWDPSAWGEVDVPPGCVRAANGAVVCPSRFQATPSLSDHMLVRAPARFR